MTALVLRRANVSRISGQWQDEDYDVFDGDREIGRIYLIDSQAGSWFWGVSFQVIKRKSYGYALSLDEAKAAFGPSMKPRKVVPDDLFPHPLVCQDAAAGCHTACTPRCPPPFGPTSGGGLFPDD